MKKKKFFNEKIFLDQCGLYISKDNYEQSLQVLYQLCLFSPYKTQLFTHLFINIWCAKILNLLENKYLDPMKEASNILNILIELVQELDRFICL